MAEKIITIPCGFISRDGKTRINATLWTTESWGMGGKDALASPKGVIQIVHGMAEHSGRYARVARFFAHQGYVVCAEDHIGHGLSARDESELGHMPLRDGREFLVADVHTLRCRISRCFPGIPYILYGHSMGSLITRAYITEHGEGLSACVLAGTANGPVLASKAGETLAHLIASVKGDRYRSRFLDNLGVGSYARKIANARTPLDWLSTDPEVIDAYTADELSGQMFTVGGYATLLSLLIEVASPEWARKVPTNLPLLFIAGSDDPVGEMGKGVEGAVSLLREAGHPAVDVRIYEGLRHELHNEPNHEEVLTFVLEWMNDVIEHVRS